MAFITGIDVDQFEDRKIKVRIGLVGGRDEPEAARENAGKLSPKLLKDAKRLDGAGFIGNAVVCEAGSHINFQISTDQALCGTQAFIKTNQETITRGKYYSTTTVRYGHVEDWTSRYDDRPETIKVNEWGTWSVAETLLRQDVTLLAKEVIGFTKDGVRYPLPLSDADVAPGGLGGGVVSQEKFGKISDVQIGNELGAMSMKFYVLKGPQAVQAFYESVRGINPNAKW